MITPDFLLGGPGAAASRTGQTAAPAGSPVSPPAFASFLEGAIAPAAGAAADSAATAKDSDVEFAVALLPLRLDLEVAPPAGSGMRDLAPGSGAGIEAAETSPALEIAVAACSDGGVTGAVASRVLASSVPPALRGLTQPTSDGGTLAVAAEGSRAFDPPAGAKTANADLDAPVQDAEAARDDTAQAAPPAVDIGAILATAPPPVLGAGDPIAPTSPEGPARSPEVALKEEVAISVASADPGAMSAAPEARSAVRTAALAPVLVAADAAPAATAHAAIPSEAPALKTAAAPAPRETPQAAPVAVPNEAARPAIAAAEPRDAMRPASADRIGPADPAIPATAELPPGPGATLAAATPVAAETVRDIRGPAASPRVANASDPAEPARPGEPQAVEGAEPAILGGAAAKPAETPAAPRQAPGPLAGRDPAAVPAAPTIADASQAADAETRAEAAFPATDPAAEAEAPPPPLPASGPVTPAGTVVERPFAGPPPPEAALTAAAGASWRLDAETSAPAAPVATERAAAPAPREVASQITLAVSGAAAQQVDIRLDPPELGRVQIRLNPTEGGGLQAVVLAERPETQDFLRRHADTLMRDLADAGYADVTLDFAAGGEAQRQRESARDERRFAQGYDAGPALAAIAPGAAAPRGPDGGGLDIRL